MIAHKKLLFSIALFYFLSLSNIHCEESEDVEVQDEVEIETEEDDVEYASPSPSGSHYLAENFDNTDKFKNKWVLSQAKKEGIDEELAKYDGVWEVEAPRRDGLKSDLGLVLKSKAKHAAISARLDRPFQFIDKPLVVQYEVNFQEGQECGGAYLKLLSQGPETADLKQFYDRTPYTIMFGPDKCGNDFKLHFIFRHKNPKNGTYEEKHCKKPKDRLQEAFEDKKPHLYTLVLYPDNTFRVLVDHKVVNDGSLLEDFTPAVNPDAEIDDPEDAKPASWDEREKIPDPEAKKPEDWDEDAPKKILDASAKKPEDWLEDETLMIPDPDADKPEDWDSDMDGEWEAPLVDNPACEGVSGCGPWQQPTIDNPAYKGKWRAPMIDNPAYQGKWKPRRIPNPFYFLDKAPFRMTTIAAVGLELWSMSPSILFDNIIVTDSLDVADDYAAKSYDLKRRKIDRDALTMYGRMMRSINYKPGWWTIYGIYCSIPIIAYGYYLYWRVKEESVLTRFLKYSNDRPYLYAVYIVAIGLPIALLFVFCCSDSSKDTNEDAKKTDAYTPDDAPAPAKSKSQLDIPEENAEDEEEGEEDEEEADDGDVSQEGSQDEEEDGRGDGDGPRVSPRRRKPMKE